MDKIKLRYFLIFILFFIPLAVLEAKEDRETGELIGPVRSVTVEQGRWESGTWAPGEGVMVNKRSYGDNGKVIETEMAFYKDGILHNSGIYRSIHTYEPENNKEISTSYGGDGKLSKRIVRIGSADGKQGEEYLYNAEGVGGKRYLYKLDDQGRNVETIAYKSDGSIHSRYVNTYDEEGNLSEAISYKADDSVDYKAVNTYDENGNWVEGIIYNADESIDRKSIHRYDAKGMETEMAVYDADGLLLQKESYSYHYDTIGNWIMWTTKTWEHEEGNREYVTKRTIQYY
jgi:hypothetical protein